MRYLIQSFYVSDKLENNKNVQLFNKDKLN